MKVFVSPGYPYSNSIDCYAGTILGEIVTPWSCGACTHVSCPHIGFIGLESRGVTSFARVANRLDVNEEVLALMLKADPNVRNPRTEQLEDYVAEYLDWVAEETIELANQYAVGQIVERCLGGVVAATTKKTA